MQLSKDELRCDDTLYLRHRLCRGLLMALRKSDLYGSLWKMCDELRGGMDASQYKDYILTILFVKYVSDKAKADKDSLIQVPEGASFDDIVELKGKTDIGDQINKVIGRLATANKLEKVIDLADFNDDEKLGRGKEKQDRLTKLVGIFEGLDFQGSRAEGDDLLGDAYEYLMRHFATESGKSKGQFYTPAEVSHVLAKVVGIGSTTRQDQTVYDPTCGSGSLLLKVAAESPRGITVYGQEKDNATWALAKMNMILHSAPDADIRKGDTITSPQHLSGEQLRTFDHAVANPPFSIKSWSNGLENDYGRFEYGRPPEKNGDYAFLLHILKSLKTTGTAAVILPHGVLFRGNAEHSIRKELLRRGFVKGIIGLPANLFYGTGIPACILVLDKENASGRTGVFMVDASKGFAKDGAKNRLRHQDIHKIIDVFTRQLEVDRYSLMVPFSKISDPKNDFNLNLTRYIDTSLPDDIQDLHAHIHGGIPERDIDALGPYWDALPDVRQKLFVADRPGFLNLAVPLSEVASVVLGSASFASVVADVQTRVGDWFESHRSVLAGIKADTSTPDLVTRLGESLLTCFTDVPLLDKYDVYEQMLSYWDETMHDDVFRVMNDGWADAARPRSPEVIGHDKNGKAKYELADIQTGSRATLQKFVMDLLPPSVIANQFFETEQIAVTTAQAAAETAESSLEQFLAEHTIEDGLLANVANERGQVSKKAATAALKAATAIDDEESAACLTETLVLIADHTDKKTAAKAAAAEFDTVLLGKYQDLADDEVIDITLDSKWKAAVDQRVGDVLAASIATLIARITQLAERYETTDAELDEQLHSAHERVNVYLTQLGVL